MRIRTQKNYFAPRQAVGNLRDIPGGIKGVRETLRAMAKVARKGSTNVEVRALALGIVKGRSVKHVCRVKDYKCEAAELLKWIQSNGRGAAKLLAWVQKNIRWTRDVRGAETVQTPERTLDWRAGDCDDVSSLLAALAMSIGFETRFKVIAADPNRPNDFSHVYVILKIDNQWVPADPSVQKGKGRLRPAQLGWEAPTIYKSKVFSISMDRFVKS